MFACTILIYDIIVISIYNYHNFGILILTYIWKAHLKWNGASKNYKSLKLWDPVKYSCLWYSCYRNLQNKTKGSWLVNYCCKKFSESELCDLIHIIIEKNFPSKWFLYIIVHSKTKVCHLDFFYCKHENLWFAISRSQQYIEC